MTNINQKQGATKSLASGKMMCIQVNTKSILLMDCAPAHLGKEVLAPANGRELQICYMPANCTHFLQPLDVGCFAPTKIYLRNSVRDVLSKKGACSKSVNKVTYSVFCVVGVGASFRIVFVGKACCMPFPANTYTLVN